jgi:Na+-driven multidrug efflux pump
MEKSLDAPNFGTEKISKIILKIAPPVMIAQLIQAMYNIVDSFFVGKYSEDAVTALISPTFFQAIGESKASTILSLTRQVFCLIPLFWLFSKIGLSYTWIAFPLSETITSTVGIILYCKELKKWKPIKQSQK